MRIRGRILVTSLAVSIPLAVGWTFLDATRQLGNRQEELRLSLELDIASGLRERCEADPPRAGRPGRGGSPDFARVRAAQRPRRPPRGGQAGAFEYFAYDASGRPSALDAPPLPAGAEHGMTGTFWSALAGGPTMIAELAPDGPCAIVLARIPPRPRERRDQAESLALVVVSVVAATWFSAGPLVTRLRRLDADIRRAAASQYAQPVPASGHDEVSDVAHAFNDAGQQVRSHLDDLQAREATLRDYVANTTHDVAIPLTVLQGHLADLDRRLVSHGDERAVVKLAVQEAHYMSSLLRNLATATRLDAALPAVLAPVDLSALVGRVVARHRPLARAQGVSLEEAVPDPPIFVQSDPTLLEQALGNLVDNAVRYNNAGGHVAVLLDRADDGTGFQLSVTDDGPGIPDDQIATLTTRWVRGADARTRRPDGTGLGLAIASEALRRLGLRFSLSRPSGGGLRAAITG